MAKDHSDSERENVLLPHGLIFLKKMQGFFCVHHPTDRITHTTTFVIPVIVIPGALAETRTSSMGPP